MKKNLIKNKKGQAGIGLVILGILVIGVLASAGIVKLDSLASIIGFSSVYKAEYGSVCCQKSGTWDVANYWQNGGAYSITCTKSDECRISIQDTRTSGGILTPLSSIIVNGNLYTLTYGQKTTIAMTMKNGEVWNVQPLILGGNDRVVSEVQYWNLRALENGKQVIFTSGTCDLSADLKHKTPATFLNTIPHDTCQNYFLDYINVASQTYSYNNQEVICQTRELYSITNMALKDGSTIKLQGDRIASVQCCPNEANCNVDTFTFQNNQVKTCTTSLQCENAGEPFGLTQTTAGIYSCVDGTCQMTTLNVQCTSDAVCLQRFGAGKICDMSIGHYGNCIEAKPSYCGDGYCDIGESKSTCPADCNLQCMADEKLVTTTKNVNCFIGFPLYIGCEKAVEQKCEKAGWNWTLIIALIVGLLIIAVFWKKIFAGFRFVLNKIGVRI